MKNETLQTASDRDWVNHNTGNHHGNCDRLNERTHIVALLAVSKSTNITFAFIQHPGWCALHVDGRSDCPEFVLGEEVVALLVILGVILCGGDETIAFVEIWHGSVLFRLGVDCVVSIRSDWCSSNGLLSCDWLVHAFRHRQNGWVDLRVQIVERLLG